MRKWGRLHGMCIKWTEKVDRKWAAAPLKTITNV